MQNCSVGAMVILFVIFTIICKAHGSLSQLESIFGDSGPVHRPEAKDRIRHLISRPPFNTEQMIQQRLHFDQRFGLFLNEIATSSASLAAWENIYSVLDSTGQLNPELLLASLCHIVKVSMPTIAENLQITYADIYEVAKFNIVHHNWHLAGIPIKLEELFDLTSTFSSRIQQSHAMSQLYQKLCEALQSATMFKSLCQVLGCSVTELHWLESIHSSTHPVVRAMLRVLLQCRDLQTGCAQQMKQYLRYAVLGQFLGKIDPNADIWQMDSVAVDDLSNILSHYAADLNEPALSRLATISGFQLFAKSLLQPNSHYSVLWSIATAKARSRELLETDGKSYKSTVLGRLLAANFPDKYKCIDQAIDKIRDKEARLMVMLLVRRMNTELPSPESLRGLFKERLEIDASCNVVKRFSEKLDLRKAAKLKLFDSLDAEDKLKIVQGILKLADPLRFQLLIATFQIAPCWASELSDSEKRSISDGLLKDNLSQYSQFKTYFQQFLANTAVSKRQPLNMSHPILPDLWDAMELLKLTNCEPPGPQLTALLQSQDTVSALAAIQKHLSSYRKSIKPKQAAAHANEIIKVSQDPKIPQNSNPITMSLYLHNINTNLINSLAAGESLPNALGRLYSEVLPISASSTSQASLNSPSMELVQNMVKSCDANRQKQCASVLNELIYSMYSAEPQKREGVQALVTPKYMPIFPRLIQACGTSMELLKKQFTLALLILSCPNSLNVELLSGEDSKLPNTCHQFITE